MLPQLKLLFMAGVLLFTQFSITNGQEEQNPDADLSCSKYHACQSPLKSCYCDPDCDLFEDCCQDFQVTEATDIEKLTLTCQDSVVRISSCAKAWDGPDDIRYRCQLNSTDWENPLLRIPWTNALSASKTYKNFYCAICNQDRDHASPWDVILQSSESSAKDALEGFLNRDNIWDELHYYNGDNGMSAWGIFIEQQFYPLHLRTQPKASQTVRHCASNLIKNCPEDWEDDEIKEKCSSFLAPVYDGATGYRNVYCARCHKVNLKNSTCNLNANSSTMEIDTGLSGSFSLLLDWSFENNPEKCSEGGARWDPFLKVCHIVGCPEHTVYQKGRCVREPPGRNYISRKRETTEEVETNSEDYLAIDDDGSIECVLTSFEELDGLKYGSKLLKTHRNATFYFFNDKLAYSCIEKWNQSFSNGSVPKVEGEINVCKNFCEPISNFTITEGNYLFLSESNSTIDRFFIIDGQPCLCENEDDCKMLVITKHQNPHFCHCGIVTLDLDEFEVLDEDTIFVRHYNRTYNSSWYDKTADGVEICYDFGGTDGEDENTGQKFPEYMSHITLVGIMISIICILLHIIAFCIIPEMRNLPGLDLTSLCVALLLGYTSFLCVQADVGHSVCVAIALCTTYFFLASFFWMNTISFDVWRSLYVATTTLRISGRQNKWKRFFFYSAYSWLSPLAIVASTLIIELNPDASYSLKPGFGKDICWFDNRYALFIFFGLPLIILLALNVLFFLFSSCIILMSTIKSSKDDACPPRKNFKLYIRLAIMMGLTWITGILATITNAEIIYVVFILFNTLQGLLIFAGFTCSNPVFKKICQSVFSSAFRSTASNSNATEHSIPSTMMTYK